MTITKEFVGNLFSHLEKGQPDLFFAQVADNVNWHVMGTHPLAGTYKSKADFLAHTFTHLNKILKNGPHLKVNHLFIAEDKQTAIIEMSQTSDSIANTHFNNTYCWIVIFTNNIITEVRAYLDSALVQQLLLDTYQAKANL